MRVLSLFDGMSCGHLALERAGFHNTQYFASEICPYAKKVAQANFPNTLQLGDVTKVSRLPVDLLMGGSPCQGFSYCGKRRNFDDPRSKLFFEYVRLKNAINPQWWLLENVPMVQDSEDVITEYLGVEPIKINSSLVSAQNRPRLYWTNIPVAPLADKGIQLKDITIDGSNKSGRVVGRCIINGKRADGRGPTVQRLEPRLDNKAGCLTRSQKNSVVVTETGYRNFTVTECERLQTVPEGYTSAVSNTRRFEMLGNGWTIDVIAHILSGIDTS